MSTHTTNIHTPEMVDLGLPSETKWAKTNIGAECETDYGLYFKWGEAEGHTSDERGHFDWSYPETFTDAATAAYGEGFRMPTKEDFEELIRYTYRSVETVNGVKGMRFASVIDNSKYIFIPFAGFCSDGLLRCAGSLAEVWSSTPGDCIAYILDCIDLGNVYTNYDWRKDGCSVRAVSE